VPIKNTELALTESWGSPSSLNHSYIS